MRFTSERDIRYGGPIYTFLRAARAERRGTFPEERSQRNVPGTRAPHRPRRGGRRRDIRYGVPKIFGYKIWRYECHLPCFQLFASPHHSRDSRRFTALVVHPINEQSEALGLFHGRRAMTSGGGACDSGRGRGRPTSRRHPSSSRAWLPWQGFKSLRVVPPARVCGLGTPDFDFTPTRTSPLRRVHVEEEREVVI